MLDLISQNIEQATLRIELTLTLADAHALAHVQLLVSLFQICFLCATVVMVETSAINFVCSC